MKRIINNLLYSIKKYKFLLEQLVSRDFKVKYKRGKCAGDGTGRKLKQKEA